jgi:hypothetical protein
MSGVEAKGIYTTHQNRINFRDMNMAVLWDVTACSLVDTDRRFREAYYLYHQGDRAVKPSETAVNIFSPSNQNFVPSLREQHSPLIKKFHTHTKQYQNYFSIF